MSAEPTVAEDLGGRWTMMMDGWDWGWGGMGLIGLLLLVFVVLGIAALLKYLLKP
jgi:hypothetical protein